MKKDNKTIIYSRPRKNRLQPFWDKVLSFILYQIYKGFSLFQWYVIPMFGNCDPFHYRVKLLMKRRIMPEKFILGADHGFHSKIIVVGFDGTCVQDKFPRMGIEIPAASAILYELVATGHRIILNTIRRDFEAIGKTRCDYLSQAVKWFEKREIPHWGVNANPLQESRNGNTMIDADLIIDVRAIGIPLITVYKGSKPIVNWIEVENLLKQKGYYWSEVR